MSAINVRVLPDADALGDLVGGELLDMIARARAAGARFLLGSPTGRTPKPIYAAMARQLAAKPQDLSHVTVVMMDEYLAPRGGALGWAPPEAAWSCHWFGRHEIAERLNAALKPGQRLRDDAFWFPDPRDPAEYDRRIADAGGIDYFLLASGASDGHVAFNPPGSRRDTETRVIPLSEETRRDNLQTFPVFGTLDAVPHHGVSVGIATICRSKAAAMVALGSGKRLTVRRIRDATRYESDWPATLIHECANASLIVDEAAAGWG